MNETGRIDTLIPPVWPDSRISQRQRQSGNRQDTTHQDERQKPDRDDDEPGQKIDEYV